MTKLVSGDVERRTKVSSLGARCPVLDAFCEAALRLGDLEVWLFGSSLQRLGIGTIGPIYEPPDCQAFRSDVDLLVVYPGLESLGRVQELRRLESWDEASPPLHIIAMTVEEAQHYRFIGTTGAVRIV